MASQLCFCITRLRRTLLSLMRTHTHTHSPICMHNGLLFGGMNEMLALRGLALLTRLWSMQRESREREQGEEQGAVYFITWPGRSFVLLFARAHVYMCVWEWVWLRTHTELGTVGFHLLWIDVATLAAARKKNHSMYNMNMRPSCYIFVSTTYAKYETKLFSKWTWCDIEPEHTCRSTQHTTEWSTTFIIFWFFENVFFYYAVILQCIGRQCQTIRSDCPTTPSRQLMKNNTKHGGV